jgi:molybdopterin converting factor small subunit
MPKVSVDFWTWMGKDLGGNARSSSEMRSILEIVVEDGTTARMLLDRLAQDYRPVAEKVFQREKQRLYPHVVAILNDRVIREIDLYDAVLNEGDRITILPQYVGG